MPHIPSHIITGENLVPTPDITFAETPEQPVPVVPELKLTEPEKKVQTLTEELSGLQEQLIGESAFGVSEEERAGLPGLRQTQQDLTSRLQVLTAEQQAIPLRIEEEFRGRGVTKRGIKPIRIERLQRNAIQSLAVSAQLQATQGNISTALELVDRAVAAKFDPIKEKIRVRLANLDLILDSPEFSVAEKNRARKQKAGQEAEERRIEEQEGMARLILQTANTVALAGADAETLKRITDILDKDEITSEDVIEANRLAAPFVGERLGTQVIEVDGRKLLINTQTVRTHLPIH